MANDRLILYSSSGKELVIATHCLGAWRAGADLETRLDKLFSDDFTEDGREFYYLATEFCDCVTKYNDCFDWHYRAVKLLGDSMSEGALNWEGSSFY